MKSPSLHSPDYKKFVELLKKVRCESGLTQVELAQRLGVHQSLISKIEKQERRIDILELMHLCKALDYPLSVFVERFEMTIQQPSLESVYDEHKR